MHSVRRRGGKRKVIIRSGVNAVRLHIAIFILYVTSVRCTVRLDYSNDTAVFFFILFYHNHRVLKKDKRNKREFFASCINRKPRSHRNRATPTH